MNIGPSDATNLALITLEFDFECFFHLAYGD